MRNISTRDLLALIDEHYGALETAITVYNYVEIDRSGLSFMTQADRSQVRWPRAMRPSGSEAASRSGADKLATKDGPGSRRSGPATRRPGSPPAGRE